ncbi:MAG TPA: hypothetical protein VKY74_01125 [Chloroflexia bacterium]|nr:hypothetical protein [Chloroflexia bacterium]
MTNFQDHQLERFLTAHAPALTAIFLQAYAAAGGHYRLLSPEEQARQAAIDSQEFVADLLRGEVDQQAVRQTVQTTAQAAAVADILRMVTIQERLFVALLRAELATQPELATELERRCRNLMARFRVSLAGAQADAVLRRFGARPD